MVSSVNVLERRTHVVVGGGEEGREGGCCIPHAKYRLSGAMGKACGVSNEGRIGCLRRSKHVFAEGTV